MVRTRGGLLSGLSRAPSHAQEHCFMDFCHKSWLYTSSFFTDIPFFFLTGSTSVCYKPTSPVQVLEDTGFLYQDHQLFAGRHEVSPLTAEAISAKEKAGKCVATLPYKPTTFASMFFPGSKLSSLDYLQIIFTELKATFSSSVESKGSYLGLECYDPPSFVTCACGGCSIAACPSGQGCSSLCGWTEVHSFFADGAGPQATCGELILVSPFWTS